MRAATEDNSGYFQPAFVICVAVMDIVGGGMSIAQKKLGLALKKRPLPLKRSLDLMDEAALAPYEVAAKLKIENEEILTSLGTTDYIQWVLEDPCQPTESPVRRVMLFVTYYALPDRVPHVPEECYTGGGYQRLATDTVRLRIIDSDPPREISGRCLVFGTSDTNLLWAARFPVLYFFRVNGQYAGSRNGARMALNRNIFSPYSYFCKVELVFNQSSSAPTQAEAVVAAEKLLTVVLPQLESHHWPDKQGLQSPHQEQERFDSTNDTSRARTQTRGN
ncbi:MAG: hypothetical protein JSW27_24955 [Phycisphaerales bacterium]|nr:MAG: hypothetical protein JSW27_24955 [Phycisphaerales bacterium]